MGLLGVRPQPRGRSCGTSSTPQRVVVPRGFPSLPPGPLRPAECPRETPAEAGVCVPTLRPPLGVAGSGEQGGPVTGTSSQHVAGAEAEQVLAGDRRSAKVAWEPCARWPFQPPRVPPHGPAGLGGGVSCQSQSRAPEGPGRPGDVPAHALQAPPQAQVPRGQQGEPTAQLLPLLSCHTDVIFL